MFSYVYVLRSLENDDLYIGQTGDLKKRLAECQNGKSRYTKGYRSWELVYYKAHTNAIDTERREKYLKTTIGNRALGRMLRAALSRRSTT